MTRSQRHRRTFLILSAISLLACAPEDDLPRPAAAAAALTVAECPAGYNVIEGTDQADSIVGTNGDDCIIGGNGDDTIDGRGGDDVISGGGGSDTLAGGNGNDTIYGGAEDDLIDGGNGQDSLFGEAGNDTLHGGNGSDLLDGGDGADSLAGDNGRDDLLGGAGNDVIDGGGGPDVIDGGDGNDVIIPSNGPDTIDGGDGNDACNGTSCELDPVSGDECLSDADCNDGQTCIQPGGVCLSCLTDRECEAAVTSACAAQTTCSPTVGCESDGPPVCEPSSPPAADTTASVGFLESSLSVNSYGAASLEVPIDVSPGRGMQPTLTLSYNSARRGAPLLGVGWQLEGLSSITRCNEHVPRGGTVGGTRTRAAFCFDGSPLAVSGTNTNGDTEYTAQRNHFLRFTFVDEAHWRVDYPDGSTANLGTTDNGRISSIGGETLIWALERLADHAGNYMQVDYLKIAIDTGGNNVTVRYRAERISYSGHSNGLEPQRFVELTYEPTTRPRQALHGIWLDHNSRLSSVRSTGLDGATYRQYNINYNRSNATDRELVASLEECGGDGAARTCRPPLRFAYTQFGRQSDETLGDVVPGTITPRIPGNADHDSERELFYTERLNEPPPGFPGQYPDSFDWYEIVYLDGLDRFVEDPLQSASALPPAHVRRTNTFIPHTRFWVLDWNFDGIDDIVTGYLDNLFVQLGTGNGGFLSGGSIGVDFVEAESTIRNDNFHFTDLNGDSVSDIFYCRSIDEGAARWAVHYRGENGLGPQITTPFGCPNRFQDTYDVRMWPTSRTFRVPTTREPFWAPLMVDVDADGIAEWIHLSDGYGAPVGIYRLSDEGEWVISDIPLPDFAEDPDTIHALDINGDGAVDLVTLSDGEPEDYRYILVRWNRGGTGFSPLTPLTGPAVQAADFAAGVIADFDLDGRMDMLLPVWEANLAVTRWWWFRSSGEALERLAPPTENLTATTVSGVYRRPTIVDIGADGHPDIVHVQRDLSVPGIPQLGDLKLRFYGFAGNTPDLLQTIGEGGSTSGSELASQSRLTTNIQYRALSATREITSDGITFEEVPSVHTPTEACEYPFYCRSHSYNAVFTTQSNSDITTLSVNSYSGAMSHMPHAGFLGFAGHRTWSVSDGLERNAYFERQLEQVDGRFPYLGVETRSVEERYTDVSVGGGLGEPESHAETTTTYELLGTSEWHTPVPLSSHQVTIVDGAEVSNSTTTYAHDAHGNQTLARVVGANGDSEEVVSSYAQNLDRHLLNLIESRRIRSCTARGCAERGTNYYYDNLDDPLYDRVVSQEGHSDHELIVTPTYTEYGTLGSILVQHGEESHSSSMEYDTREHQFIVRSTDPMGHVERFEIHPIFGRPWARRDHNGIVTVQTYDALGRVTEQFTPQLAVRTTFTTEQGSEHPVLISRRDGGGEVIREFDALSRPTQTTWRGANGERVRQVTSYDPDTGLVRRTSAPFFVADGPSDWTTYTYAGDDAEALPAAGLARPLRVERADNTSNSYQYEGLTTHVTDGVGSVTTFTRDAVGRLSRREDPAVDGVVGVTRYAYGPFNRLAVLTDAEGNETVFQHDEFGRTTKTEDPNVGTTENDFNGFGELVESRHLQSGDYFRHQYDALGRRTVSEGPNGTATWEYDSAANGIGRVHTATSTDNVTTTYTYDQASRVAAVRQSDGVSALSASFDRDALGRLSTMTLPSQSGRPARLSYTYGDYGHLTAVSEENLGELWHLDQANADGAVTEESFGNGTTSSWILEPVSGNPLTITTRSPMGIPLHEASYIYEANGQLGGRTMSFAATPGTTAETFTETFAYDEVGRLDTARVLGVTGEEQSLITASYSPSGRILHRSDVGSYDYTSERPHAATSAGPERPEGFFSYDAHGRQTRRGTQEIDFNDRGLPSAIRESGETAVTYKYAPDGERWESRTDALTTHYFGDLYDVTSPNDPSLADIEVSHIHVQGRHIADLTRFGDGSLAVSYLHSDRARSNTMTTNSSGEVVSRRAYDPFGNDRGPDGSSVPEGERPDRGFQGLEDDRRFGVNLRNFNARLYDPAIGLFVSPDPILNPSISQDVNRYSLGHNDPLNVFDRSGLDESANDDIPLDANADLPPLGDTDELPPNLDVWSYFVIENGHRVLVYNFVERSNFVGRTGTAGLGGPGTSITGERNGAVGGGPNGQAGAQGTTCDSIWCHPLVRWLGGVVQFFYEAYAETVGIVWENRVPIGAAIGQAVAEAFIPGAAEASDVATVADADRNPVERGIAGLSLGANAYTAGAAPNASPIMNGIRRIGSIISNARTARRRARAIREANRLEERAREVHGVLDPIAQRRRTTAALSTTTGDRVLAAGAARDLSPAQVEELMRHETGAFLPGAHAEITTLAAPAGRPRAIGTSRPFCDDCREALEDGGAEIITETTAIWPANL